MKHTPGPWKIIGQDIFGNEPNGFICSWSGKTANAHLIASAPELLEACKAILKCINDNLLVRNTEHDHEENWAIKQIPLVQALQILKQTIDKAEGTP